MILINWVKKEFLSFVIDFDMENPVVLPLSDIDPQKVLFSVNGITNVRVNKAKIDKRFKFKAYPVSKKRYIKAFSLVQKHNTTW